MTNFWQALEQHTSAEKTASDAEYRLYYNDQGEPLFYTMETLAGNYLVIDQETYAEGNYAVRVVDGKIRKPALNCVIKLVPSSDTGTLCLSNDVSIISNSTTGQHWKLKTHENH